MTEPLCAMSAHCKSHRVRCVNNQLKTIDLAYSFHPCACTQILLILFPVPLALRWYLRSLVFTIVCLCLPSTGPSLLFRFKLTSLLPPPSSVRWHSHFHTYTRTRAHTWTLLPRRLPPSWCCLIHFSTPSTHWLQLEQGGRGWIYTSKRRPQATLRLDPLAVQRPQARRLRSRE